MALKPCHECKAQISTAAKTCPACGAPVKKKPSVVAGVLGGLLVFGLLLVLFQKPPAAPEPEPQTPEQQAAALKAREQRVEDWSRVKAVRENVNNPATFELVKVVRADSGNLCVQFRATNAFNAVMTQSVLFTATKSELANCIGMSGKDVTGAVTVDLKYGF